MTVRPPSGSVAVRSGRDRPGSQTSSTANRCSASMMTSRPEFGSVAPPARMPPKSWTATQMTAKTAMAVTSVTWANCGGRKTPAATIRQTWPAGSPPCAVVQEEGLRHTVDVGEPPRLAVVHPGHQVVQGLG